MGGVIDAYDKWVSVVRSLPPKFGNTYSPDWLPSDVDIKKSRLFWWIRSGHEPLPYPPPTAYSCPWYEVITEEGNHHALYLHKYDEENDIWLMRHKANVCQSIYDIIEQKENGNLILGYGPYRFEAFRNPELHAKHISDINGQRQGLYEEQLERVKNDLSLGWWISRVKELEIWPENNSAN